MRTTTYYALNIVEGTDIVNPLTVDNPNYEKIDEVMHNNVVSGVTLANEIANATIHAITRENSECAVFRFIATSEWKAGDTATVDGVPVTALLPSGETLPDGAYVINANVLCILTGTNLTVYAERKKVDNATEIAYEDINVFEAITKLNTDLSKEHIYRTTINITTSIAVSNMAAFNYKGVSNALAEGIEILGVSVETPSSGDWLFSTSVNHDTRIITLYANGNSTIKCDVIYRKTNG